MPVRAPWAWRRSPAAQRPRCSSSRTRAAGGALHHRDAARAHPAVRGQRRQHGVDLGGAATAVDLVLADPPYDVGAAEIDAVLAAPTS
ncbi:hypothetical protein MAHJHV29_48570 [Mycobacterium avium subsp. hominissuis]